MSIKLTYPNDNARHVAYDLASSAADSGIAYSEKFSVRDCTVWSSHFEWADDSTTYEAAVTLWASDKPNPDESSDTDWVQMVAAHNFNGLPGGDPSGGDGKDLTDISASGALWYRWKITRSVGSAVWQIYVVRKDRR